MKAMLLAAAVIIVVLGLLVAIVYRDPNRVPVQEALAVLHETSPGVPTDPAALGYLNLTKGHVLGVDGFEEFNRELSADLATKETQSWIVEGTILKQEYQLTQAEYELAQLRRVGGDISSVELATKQLAYADATRKFQTFWDTKLPTK